MKCSLATSKNFKHFLSLSKCETEKILMHQAVFVSPKLNVLVLSVLIAVHTLDGMVPSEMCKMFVK